MMVYSQFLFGIHVDVMQANASASKPLISEIINGHYTYRENLQPANHVS